MTEGDGEFMERMIRESREFMREMTLRGEKHTNETVAQLRQQTATLVDLQGEIADQRKQIQANTEAVLSVLDRMD